MRCHFILREIVPTRVSHIIGRCFTIGASGEVTYIKSRFPKLEKKKKKLSEGSCLPEYLGSLCSMTLISTLSPQSWGRPALEVEHSIISSKDLLGPLLLSLVIGSNFCLALKNGCSNLITIWLYTPVSVTGSRCPWRTDREAVKSIATEDGDKNNFVKLFYCFLM